MRNFGNFAAFGVLRMTGSSRYELTLRTIHRPADTRVLIRPVPTPAGHCPPGTIESRAGNPSSWKYVLNPSTNRVESRSGDRGSILQAYEGVPLSSVHLNSRHGLCFLRG